MNHSTKILYTTFYNRVIFIFVQNTITMKKVASTILALALLILTSNIALGQKPNIYVLATGGTIAGIGASSTATTYSAGQLAIATLLDAVPQIQNIAQVRGEQVANIGSQDMTDEVWLLLAKRVNELLEDPKTDGIVITHGTDTMEETAFFLSLAVKSPKPVVLTGAMRPSTALSADGPLNLYNAVVVAASPLSKGRGVLVAMNGIIHPAADVTKMHTTDVHTFESPNQGPEGIILNSSVRYHRGPSKSTVNFDISGVRSLPKVGILYSHSGISSDIADAMISAHYDGIIHAGVGNGNIHKNIFPSLEKARAKGIIVVRSSRVSSGPTTLDNEVDDDKYQFVASQWLNPQKSRILLMLALTSTSDWKEIQKCFDKI